MHTSCDNGQRHQKETCMRTATVTIEGVSPYSSSRVIPEDVVKHPGEDDAAFEQRKWRLRLNVDESGHGIIPPMAFAKAIQKAAYDYAGKVKGKGNTQWYKYFAQGILVIDPLPLGETRETVKGETLFVPSTGAKGAGSRVWRTFPIIHKWGGQVTVHVVDDQITPDVFEKTIRAAFKFVGIGRFRPEKGGFYGRAEVRSITWS